MSRGDSGAVLLLVLVIFVVLTVIVVQFMSTTNVDTRIADMQVAAIKNAAAIEGAFAKTIHALAAEQAIAKEEGEAEEEEIVLEEEEVIYATDPNTMTFEETTVHILVVDEHSKLNLNLLHYPEGKKKARAELQRLGEALGLTGGDAEEISDRLGWLDLPQAMQVSYEKEMNGEQANWVIRGTLGPNVDPRTGGGILRFITDSEDSTGKQRSIGLRVMALVKGPMEIRPSGFIAFGRIKRGEGASSTVEFEPTTDFDLQIEKVSFKNLTVIADYYVVPETVLDAIRRGGQFNVIHPTSGNKVDFIIARRDPWGRMQLSRRETVTLEPGLDAHVAAPEDVIIGKMEYYREGGSEKHLRDITGILKVSGRRVDRAYVAEWSERLGLSDIWGAVLRRLDETNS